MNVKYATRYAVNKLNYTILIIYIIFLFYFKAGVIFGTFLLTPPKTDYAPTPSPW